MRLVLTQAQVSVALSSGIVVFFTLLLFLSGYVLQQRTVKGLQDALRPRIPPRPRAHIVRAPDMAGERAGEADVERDVRSAAAGRSLDWSRLAHVQLARTHHDVCSAIMVLAALHKQKSPARRLLLFPQAWAEQNKAAKGEPEDPYVQSTRRLLRLAARRYNVELQPLAPLRTTRDETGEPVETYSLASAYALSHDFDRLLALAAPGTLLDAEPLDALLAFAEPTPLAMLRAAAAGGDDHIRADDLVLLQPSARLYQSLTHTLPPAASASAFHNDTHLLAALVPSPLLLSSSALVRSVATLHAAPPHAFNPTAYLSHLAYLRFSDPKLPGPEYDVPWPQKVAARPRNPDADWVWTKVYGEFAQMRMEICGLDLESWRPLNS